MNCLIPILATCLIAVDESAAPKRVAPTFQGVFIEDVSHAADVLMTPEGFREEVVDAIAALRPGFVRFPGGCAAQGRTFGEQYDWKRTICPPAERPSVSNLWGYVTNFRLGFYEYFCLAERLGAEPVPVVAAGLTCHHFSKPQQAKALGPEMDAVARDACDLVEFANGDVSTPWGAKRAAMGHPKPFGLKYLSIGNEDIGESYFVRYKAMAKALKARHPEIRLLAAAHRAMEGDQGYPQARRTLTADVADILDEHFYFKRTWLEKNGRRFDGYPRLPRLAVTEYAHKEPGTENTPRSALLDMAFLLDLLRNADLVEMTSYAPLLAWKGKENWRPNLIEFDGKTLTLTANYEMQARFAADRPQEVLASRAEPPDGFRHIVGRRHGRLQIQCVNLSDAVREIVVAVRGRKFPFTVPPHAYRCFPLGDAVTRSAVDLARADVRAVQPRFEKISYACGVTDGEWADGRWAYRIRITKPWTGELPQWPCVELAPSVRDFSGCDRLVIDVFNDSIGGDTLSLFVAEAGGRVQNGLSAPPLPLETRGFHRWIVPLENWKSTDPRKIGRLHFFLTTPSVADVYLSGFFLLRKGEEAPPASATFLKEKVEPAQRRAVERERRRRTEALGAFVASCRAVGQRGNPAWIGRASSMIKVRPRSVPEGEAADRFELRLARNEYESLQVLVLPRNGDLADVSVEPLALKHVASGVEFPRSSFGCAPVGYVKTESPPPYKVGYNVATNLPGGYLRLAQPLSTGWWPDPILDWKTSVDVKAGDLQSFWVRCRCPTDQPAGVYRGGLRVKGRGWYLDFPFAIRVYDFSVPTASPLPLAITWSPGPSRQFADKAQLALANEIERDPRSPVNLAKGNLAAWGTFLADYYITMDSLYHDGSRIRWDVLARLRDEGRLGCFNLGYWDFPRALDDATKQGWIRTMHRRFDAPYRKARELGILDHAYLYGCDEVSADHFEAIRFALRELKAAYPGVTLSTTAYDRDFGIGGGALAQMDRFTPTTEAYAKGFDKIDESRAAGHQVWWYIACGPRAPYANMFVECPAIEARLLMGAQTVKWRPEGFLYYQTAAWNSRRPIDGASAFTDWNPRSWTSYHGDGSWFCCGPEGRPCATIRIENFRDGLEDYAYAREFERVTGKRCEVPAVVCRAIDQFTDNPTVLYRWRERIAKTIEKQGR